MKYRCLNCDRHFNSPLHTVEKHGVGYGPYEIIAICPYCKVADFEEINREEWEKDYELQEAQE